MDKVFTYIVKRPWRWETSTLTTWPIDFLQSYTSGEIGVARDYSASVRPGKQDLSTGNVSVVKAPANVTAGGTYAEKFTSAHGIYTVWYENTLEFGLPTFPWDARHDVGEFTLTVVVATHSGGKWDAVYDTGNFVLDIDVGQVLDQVVGKTLSHYLADNQIVAVWRCVGLLKAVGTIRVGFHWDWTWDSSLSSAIEYLVTASASISTYARTLEFTSASDSSETLTLDGEFELLGESSQPNS